MVDNPALSKLADVMGHLSLVSDSGTGVPAKYEPDEKRTLRLRFNVEAPTEYGEVVLVSGNCPELGSYSLREEEDLARGALELSWADGRWVGEVDVAGKIAEWLKFRFGVRSPDGHVGWEWGWREGLCGGDLGGLVSGFVIRTKMRGKEPAAKGDPGHEGRFERQVFATQAFKGVVFKRDKGPTIVERGADKVTVGGVLVQGKEVIAVRFAVFAERVKNGDVVCVELDAQGEEDRKGLIQEMWDGEDLVWRKICVVKRNRGGLIKWRFLIRRRVDAEIMVVEEGWRQMVLDDNDFRFIDSRVGKTAVLVAEATEGFKYPNKWRGAGIAIPVFALRSSKGCGVGEFNDLNTAVDFCVASGFQLLQLLPINDTTAFNDWRDSYPYSANSSFALHPQYLNIESMHEMPPSVQKEFNEEKAKLNSLAEIDYDKMIAVKMKYIRIMYNLYKDEFLASRAFNKWFEANESWLVPYAVFRFLMEVNGSPNFDKWGARSDITPEDLRRLSARDSFHFDYIGMAYYIQFSLHKQLAAAAAYASEKGVVFKGDLPIGVNRYCVDTWTKPHLFRRHVKAGAPPDYFSEYGQNWGFPTYDWEAMAKDSYSWWSARLSQMAKYFHAYRIDHILGFFRIWEIPKASFTGISGRFHPAIGIRRSELEVRGVWDIDRLVMPYVRDGHLQFSFRENWWKIKERFFEPQYDRLKFKDKYNTEEKITKALELPRDAPQSEKSENEYIKTELIHLYNNVCFVRDFVDPDVLHPRFGLDKTSNFNDLPSNEWKCIIKELYEDYFFRRQETLWRDSGRKKLPMLKSASSMLVCAEDLGMVSACVPVVMHETSVIGLRVQRMPANDEEFGIPARYPYETVATTSSHDTSTFRGWWEEMHPDQRRRYWHHVMNRHGDPPAECDPQIVEWAVRDHLKCPSMWAIFPLQDLLGMDGNIRRSNAKEEQINNPANSTHYWRFRLHTDLEKLISRRDLIDKLRNLIAESGRGYAY